MDATKNPVFLRLGEAAQQLKQARAALIAESSALPVETTDPDWFGRLAEIDEAITRAENTIGRVFWKYHSVKNTIES